MSRSEAHVIIAANPKSGRSSSRSKVEELRQAVVELGFSCDVEYSLEAVQSRSLSLQASGQLKAVVAAGGDGTADALANLLPAGIPILLFPLGTENLLAKHFGITGEIQQACDTLAAGRNVAVDVGSANGKLFLVMASCGFDAEVVRQMHAIRTGHINRWSYAGPILRSLRKYVFPQLTIALDGQRSDRSVAWVFVFNVPRYAASLDFCPQADPHDAQLDVCTFEKSGLGFGVGYLFRLFLRSHQSMAGFAHRRASKIVIESPTADTPFQIDGDPGGELPLTIEVLPGRLTLLVPSGRG